MKKVTFFLLVLCISQFSRAANYYWVGGTGNWSDFSNHWASTSGGNTFYNSLPGQNDNVYFDANSFSATGQTVTLDIPIVTFKDMDWTGATYMPTLKLSLAINSIEFKVYGSFILTTSMNAIFNQMNSQGIIFGGTGNHVIAFGNHELTPQGGANFYISFNGTGSYTLLDSIKDSEIFLSRGSFNTNNQFIRTRLFESTSGFPRSLDVTGSTIHVLAGTVEFIKGNLNFNGGTAYWLLERSWFDGDGLSFDKVHCKATLIGSSCHIQGASTFRVIESDCYYLYITDDETVTDTFEVLNPQATVILSGYVFTVNGEFIMNGSCGSPKTLTSGSSSFTSAISKPSGTLNINFITLENITAQGGATFNANSTTALGTTTGWNITQNGGVTYYWIGGSGNWNDSTKWSIMNCREEPANCIPGQNDNVYFGECSFHAPGQIFEITGPAFCHDITWANTPFKPEWNAYGNLDISGSMNLDTNMVVNFNSPVIFTINFISNDTEVVNTAGNRLGEIPSDVQMIFDGDGTWNLLDSLYTNDLSVLRGFLKTNGHHVNCKYLGAGGALPGGLDLSTSEVRLRTGFSKWDQNLIFKGDSATLIFLPYAGISLFDLSYDHVKKVIFNNRWATIHGGTLGNGFIDTLLTRDTLELEFFYNVNILKQANFAGPNLKLGVAGTCTLSLPGEIIFNGTAQYPARILGNNTVSGTLYRATDSLCFEFLEIAHIDAIGGAFWGAGLGCVDSGGNTGWYFSPNSLCSMLVSEENGLQSGIYVSAYPNPVFQSEAFHITSECKDQGEVILCDLFGKILQKFPLLEGACNLAPQNLAAGSYLVQINQGNRKVVRKLLVY